MRGIHHFAVNCEHTRLRLGSEGIDDSLRSNDFGFGVKARLITAIWSGWIAIMPVKPSRAPRAA